MPPNVRNFEEEKNCENDACGVRDMTLISDLDENMINCNLKTRYCHDRIYTYTGTILVAVNPYKELGIYTLEDVCKYRNSKMECLEPHVFALAEAAYSSLQSMEENQSCVISGESGAGKTETTKFILQYLCSVTSDVSTWVEQQILEANTILESFGNAKTVRNDNSSRFGKFMQVCFNGKWMIRGCIVQDYLLEQSRITFQSPHERNYHVFYQLVQGAKRNKELSELYKLRPAEYFTYLNQSGCMHIEGVDDALKFDALRLAFSVLRIPLDMVDGIFRVLSAILWLGNTTFDDIDGEKCQLTESDRQVLTTVAGLLGLQLEDIARVALLRQINVRGNITEIPLKIQEARENRHAMAKALYSRTFAWLVNHINIRTNPGNDATRFLGVLDIFGFENFSSNSFEQLCINYTNEKLHKFFNHYVFALEQEIYRQEDIQFAHIQFTDNAACLELIEKPPRCILKLLTEQCHMPKGSDSAYLTNVRAEFENHSQFVKGEDRRTWESEFGIRHYAGCVIYTVKGFVDKNRDVQQDVFFDHMTRSENAFVVELAKYQDLLGATMARMGSSGLTASRGTSKGKPTVSDSFRYQLQSLVDVLQATNPWYVRCIKPNMRKEANYYDTELVLDQLKYLGMLEIIKIRKDGYPIHLKFKHFLQRYRCVVPNKKLPPTPREAVQAILKLQTGVDKKEWQLGKTIAFLRNKVHQPLEEQRKVILNRNAIVVQRNWKRYKAQFEYDRIKNAARTIQNAYRGWLLRLQFLRKRRAAIIIQSHLRGVFAREVASALREMRRVEEEMIRSEKQPDREPDRINEGCVRSGCHGETDDIKLSQKSEVRQLARQVNNHLQHVSQESVDLDNLFSFLSAEKDQPNQELLMDEIGENMKKLVGDLDAELEDALQQELEHIRENGEKMSETNSTNQDSQQRAAVRSPNCPSLPEPTEPPPPPPATCSTNGGGPSGEPIYESVIPRESGTCSPPPLPAPPALQLRSKSPGLERLFKNSPTCGLSPRNSRPNSRASSSGATQNGLHNHDPEREQRRKCRVEKKLQEMQQIRELECETQLKQEHVYHDILEFAQKYFNSHEKFADDTIIATLTRKRKSIDIMPKYEMVTYCKNSSIPTSHIHLHDPESVNLACSIFRDLCKYMRGEVKAECEHLTIQSIVRHGLEREDLRDEILVQCVRQSTNNPSVEATYRLWLLLCLITVSFQPSKLFHKYFVSFLKKNLSFDGKLSQYVKWCLDNCNNSGASCRKYPPSSVEIAAMRRLGTIVCRFFFLDGRTKAIDIHPTDTACDAVAKLADKLGLRQTDGWAIYQSRADGEDHVRGHHYLYDVIAEWEILQNQRAAVSNCRRINSSSNAGNANNGGENRFVFKRRLFRNVREISQDPVDINLLYAQAVYSVVKRDDYPINEKVAAQLAGLQAQVSLGDPKPDKHSHYYNDVENYIPARIRRNRSADVWMSVIAEAHRQYGAGRMEVIAKVLYLTCVMQYRSYGTTTFRVIYRGYWSYGNALLLGVSCDGLSLIKADDKLTICEFAYHQIESIFVDPSDRFLTINLMRSARCEEPATSSTQKCFVLETDDKAEIGSLIVSYYPPLAIWITESEPPIRSVTNEDRTRLYRTLMECRRTLVDSGILNKPQETTGKFIINTLRRFSKNRLEKLWSENGFGDYSETYKGYGFSYWAFSRQPLTQSICKLTESEETVALQMYQILATYAGINQSNENARKLDEERATTHIQGIMERALRKESLLCELYMQLIKQTTEHPDPNSRVNTRHWSILALLCSVVLPAHRNIRKYLMTHLRKCASDAFTQEGKYARFAEKCVVKTEGTRRRQWPPSREEITCTINRRLVYARFHLMDGQYHAVEFHPSATATDVVQIIKNKIGLAESAKGYAIYEALGSSERSLLSDEKVTDVMAKWDHYRNAAENATQANAGSEATPFRKQAHLFLFKKHLFLDRYMDLEDQVEKELLYFQFLHTLRAEKFPVNRDEAMMLIALQAQVEIGDYTDKSSLEYPQIASHCLPARLAQNVSLEGVTLHHQSLCGMTPPEAKKSFLNLIGSWPLHRATVFDVTQSFTSNWPRTLWVAIDQIGVHLLEHRSRNTLCTYEYDAVLSYSPAHNCLMIITGCDNKQSKIILTTSQAFQIATLIREYAEILQNSPAQVRKRENGKSNSCDGRTKRPVSILYKPAPSIDATVI